MEGSCVSVLMIRHINVTLSYTVCMLQHRPKCPPHYRNQSSLSSHEAGGVRFCSDGGDLIELKKAKVKAKQSECRLDTISSKVMVRHKY